MARKKKPKYKPLSQSTLIDGARDRIYAATSDPVRLAKIFFPKKDATERRAAFLAIFYAIRNARDQRLATLNNLPEKHRIRQSVLTKTRAKMTRLGLIYRHDGFWTFSNRFDNALRKLIEHVEALKSPAASPAEQQYEHMFIESAKTEKVYYQLRKRKEE